ncbi:M6 family metalloprotease domain-containing protein [Paenibacillus woosongensis]|uniref:M6 family metalloprotease domain-containing protein n=1 Tax=Paenibacillus woosongensis TaxID=307580 RepID=A0AA95I7Z5_9BACL|nr:M6 family metalloprotease domain-containing protein [Paenibacillus woosongensis]WHX50991.1 M6 family metalloprotease domain-containing protein [Paenibacillus woosongensis]
MNQLRQVPPSPEVTAYLVNEYQRNWKSAGFTYSQFLIARGYQNPAHNHPGMDDHVTGMPPAGAELIHTPRKPVTGELIVKVLLVDFSDMPGVLPKEHYEDLLFSRNTHTTGSMADYYDEVSRGLVQIHGEVHGWLRMPQTYSYYTNGNSGLTDKLNREYYPRDARKLAEDAVDAALAHGVSFPSHLDALDNGTITALFIVHAGRGAEKILPPLSGNHIWSHKWQMVKPKEVAPGLTAVTYLMVPQEALLGVCAHELGHLAFQWDDFYDPNYDADGDYWDGNGMWDVMASGSYAGREMRPVHPAGLHKLQHGWIEGEKIHQSRSGLTLLPVTSAEGKVIKIKGPGYTSNQYLLLENRIREKFDGELPGEGLLVWRIDEDYDQTRSAAPGMYLIQADGNEDLNDPNDRNSGDRGDPFPGSSNNTELLDHGRISTSFPGQPSGISLKNITFDPETKEITLDIEIEERA